jgi:aminopeptidase
MDERLVRNARAALEQVLELRQGENALVVTDDATMAVGEAFRTAAEAIGAKPTWYVLPADARPLREIPEDLMVLIPDTDVAVTCFEGRAEETPFRIGLLRALSRVARRVGHAPGITEAMLREGPLDGDYEALAVSAHDLMRRLEGAVRVDLTAPGGTRLVLGVAGRPFATDTVIRDGGWGNLPCGEIWCAPLEESGDGVLVCDGSIGDLGAVPEPVRMTLERGRIGALECADAAFRQRVVAALEVDEGARVVGELGIGLNPGARITGNLLEDEKALRTVHVAFGNNADMGGGRNHSKTHRDFLVLRPTLEVTFDDGRTERLLVGGEIVPRSVPRNAAEPHRFHTVLVAVDYSDASVEALRVADAVARRDGASLTVCHVLPRPPMVSPLFPHYVAMPDTETSRAQEIEAAERLDDLVRENTPRAPEAYTVLVPWGDASQAVVELAEQRGVDLLVVANRGAGGLARWALGSVAAHVAAHARCPVLLVR